MTTLIGTLILVGVLALLGMEYYLRDVLNRAAPARPLYRPRGTVLAPAQIQAALRVGEEEPLWQAVLQLLEGQIGEALEEATDADTLCRPPLAAYYAGAARHLTRFRDFLEEEREKAMARVEEEE